jgi:hypothetical protein
VAAIWQRSSSSSSSSGSDGYGSRQCRCRSSALLLEATSCHPAH